MRRQYHCNGGVRPPDVCGSDHGDAMPARLFLCAGCRVQALICSCCDRGQIYCSGNCAQQARHRSLRSAGQRYQASRKGRLSHAARAARYRARCKNVTHQGSLPPASDDLLPPGSPMSASDAAAAEDRPRRSASHCHWCGRRCLEFVRQEFLRRRGGRRHRLQRDTAHGTRTW